MEKFVRISVIFVILAMVLGACGSPAAAPVAPAEEPAAEQPVADEAATGDMEVIRVGVNTENVPWEYMEDGELVGFEIDMLNEISTRMGVEFEYVTTQWSSMFTGLLSNKWDIASSSIWVTAEREKEMDFADPYYDSDLSLMTLADSEIASFEDMKGGVFGTDTGAMPDQWLQDNMDKYGPYEIKRYDSPTDAFLDLQAGRLDGVAADAPTALFYAADKPDLSVPLLMNEGFAQAFAFREGDALRDRFNDAQNELKTDGTLATIYEKWFKQAPPEGSSATMIYEEPFVPVAPYELPDLVRVGVNTENVPWEFMEDGNLVGFEIDMLNEISTRLDVEFEYVPTQWSSMFTGLLSNKWDIASSSIWVTQDRMKEMDFMDPYYDSDLSLMTLADTNIKSFEDMAGGVFGTDTGAMPDQWLQDHMENYGPYEIKRYDSPTDAFLDLQAGRLDGVAADAPTALYYAADKPDLAVPLLMNEGFGQAFATRIDDPIRDVVNDTINDMKTDGTLATIYEKWFKQAPPENSSTTVVYTEPYVPAN
jgi:polar amino acid transport system substrate-binding protein